MQEFVRNNLNYSYTYIYTEVKGLTYPAKYYFMPEEEYIYWGMRLFGGTRDEWLSFTQKLLKSRIATDKNTLVEAAGLSEEQAAHWPDGIYIGIEEDNGYRHPYTTYSKQINRVENIRLHDDLGVTVTLHYNPEQTYNFTTAYIDVSFLWDDELGFIVESFEKRESDRITVSIKGDCEIADLESDNNAENTALLDEAGDFFDFAEGEYSRNRYSTDNREYIVSNRKCYTFDSVTRRLINSKPLPEFLVSEDTEDHTYVDFVVNDDLSEISYAHQYEYPEYYSIYLCSLDSDQEPVKLLTLDPDKSDIQQEYYHVARFLENDRLLMYVGGWEWVYRFEIMDKSGNVLLEIPSKENGPFAGYGGGFADYNDNMMILSSMSKTSENNEEIIQPKYYYANFNQLTLTQLDWIYNLVPLTDEVNIGGNVNLVLSEELTHGVFSVCYTGEAGVPFDRTEFYFVDFMNETATLLPQIIENRRGYPTAIVGDHYYFTYSAVRGVDNEKSVVDYAPPTYIARLPIE